MIRDKQQSCGIFVEIIKSCYAKQHRCGIFVAPELENVEKVQSTETILKVSVLRTFYICYASFLQILRNSVALSVIDFLIKQHMYHFN